MSLVRKFITKKWWAYGLWWGFFMWLGTRIIFPLIEGEKITMVEFWLGIPFWLGFGLFFGWAFTPKEESKSKQEKIES